MAISVILDFTYFAFFKKSFAIRRFLQSKSIDRSGLVVRIQGERLVKTRDGAFFIPNAGVGQTQVSI